MGIGNNALETELRIERDEDVPKMLMRDYEFTQETANRLWENSRTRKEIESAKDMVCRDDLDIMIQDRLMFMDSSEAYRELGFEMEGSRLWMGLM